MSETSSDDETEFITVEETPVVKTIKNAKGRKAGLALAREKNTAQRRAVKNVMEAHKAVQKVKTLSEKAGTAYTISKQKALSAGMELPEVPPIENRLGDMLASMQGEIDRLKALREPPAPAPEPKKKRVVKKKVVEEEEEEEEAPKPKPKPKAKAPEPKPEPVQENVIVHTGPTLTIREQRFKESQEKQANQMDLLRQALGRR
jgi:hypothetical protein